MVRRSYDNAFPIDDWVGFAGSLNGQCLIPCWGQSLPKCPIKRPCNIERHVCTRVLRYTHLASELAKNQPPYHLVVNFGEGFDAHVLCFEDGFDE